MVFRNLHIRFCPLLPLILGVSCPLLFKAVWLAFPTREVDTWGKTAGVAFGKSEEVGCTVMEWIEGWWTEKMVLEESQWCHVSKTAENNIWYLRNILLRFRCPWKGHRAASKQGLWCTTSRPVHKFYCFKGFNFPGVDWESLGPYFQWVPNERDGGIAGREVTEKCSFVFQAGNLDGFFSVVESCPIMTRRKMPGRVVREASKWPCVKFKVTKIQ